MPLDPNTAFGTPGIGEIPWGSHLCCFYWRREELISSLVPYFREGLRRNERCVWITAPPLPADEARAELGKVLPGVEEFLENGKLLVRDWNHWYQANPAGVDVLEAWLAQEERALRSGSQGLRIAGNMSFLERERWPELMNYEGRANKAFGGRRIVAYCTYHLRDCKATDVFEAVHNHHFTISCRNGEWETLETSHRRPAR
jgi:hypothetical protein